MTVELAPGCPHGHPRALTCSACGVTLLHVHDHDDLFLAGGSNYVHEGGRGCPQDDRDPGPARAPSGKRR